MAHTVLPERFRAGPRNEPYWFELVIQEIAVFAILIFLLHWERPKKVGRVVVRE
jgi:hypothetical protein